MKKVLINDIKYIGKVISDNKRSIVFSKEQEIIKIYRPKYLKMLRKYHIDKEKMLLSSEKFRHFKELTLPTKIYYKPMDSNYSSLDSQWIK